MADWWLRLLRNSLPYDSSCFVVPALCNYRRSPRYFDGRVFDQRAQSLFDSTQDDEDRIIGVTLEEYSRYPYGYHFDATQLAEFLAQYSVRAGVRRVLDTVSNVELDSQGNIRSVDTESHGPIEADLYVDCSGFKAILISGALHEPFISYANELPNDRAIAARIPYAPSGTDIDPYTTATALSAGWAWNIPLYHRLGTGYVYSSAFREPEDAEVEFRQHLGPKGSDIDVSHIRMRIGRSRNSWVRNCVAIGLSSGFVEPLESTGIFFIQHAVEELANHFPFQGDHKTKQLSYNAIVNACMDGIRDFLVIHYVASDRRDTDYWRSMEDLDPPPELAERLRIWKEYSPNIKNVPSQFHGFQVYSYTCILFGLGYLPASIKPLLYIKDETLGLRAFERKWRLAATLAKMLPSHREYLDHVRSEAYRGQEALTPDGH